MAVNKCNEMYEEKRESEYCTENRPVTGAYSVSTDSSNSKEQSLGYGNLPVNQVVSYSLSYMGYPYFCMGFTVVIHRQKFLGTPRFKSTRSFFFQ